MQQNLPRLLRKSSPAYNLISELLVTFGASITILDAQKYPLLVLGAPAKEEQAQTAVRQGDSIVGWVTGPVDQGAVIGGLLEKMLLHEAEKGALSDELIDTYRELNILYTLSEHLLATPEPEVIASTTLNEIRKLIKISSAWVLLESSELKQMKPIASTGASAVLRENIGQDDFVGGVIARNEAEICNDLPGDQLFARSSAKNVAAVCAPLRTEHRVLGSLLLVSEPPFEFAARDLKLLKTIALQAGPAIEMARLYQIAIVQGRMERELQLAYEVQASLIPSSIPAVEAGWEFAGRWRPARELSGDYYDVIPHGPHNYGLVIADVADKGMPSALFMVNTRSAVRTAVDQNTSPAAAIAQVNRLIARETTNGLFVSMIYGQLDSNNGSFVYVNAGHNPALMFRAADGQLDELSYTGIPVGILADTKYVQKRVKLQSGDSLILYTDGVTEAMNPENNEFGIDRLRSIILKNPRLDAGSLAATIESAVDQFTAPSALFDDFTLMIVRRL